MRKLLSLFLSFLLALPSFVIPLDKVEAAQEGAPSFNINRDCPNANCVTRLSGLLEAKINRARAESCLPPVDTKNEQVWFETNTLSADCFKLVKEIEEDIARLESIQTHYSNLMIQDEERMCRETEENAVFNAAQLRDVQRATAAASCTEARKSEVWSQCGRDASCVLISTAAGIAGPLSNALIPKGMRAQGCSGSQDNCLKQLALGFVKSVFSFFEGAWGLLKSAGTAIGNGVANQARRFWNWVTDAEDRSSTAQLSAAQASEEEGIFRQLKNDFRGTMVKMWTGLVAALKHWLANSVFCQKWSGTPQFSKCLEPAQGFGCTSCKAMITGMCAMVGVIASEVIPAFLTGGLVTVAKYGVSGASRVASLVRVSAPTMRALKGSRLAGMAIRPVARLTQRVASSRFTQAGLRAMKRGVSAVGRFIVTPLVKGFKGSFAAMRSVARAGGTFAMMTPAGPVITFGKKALGNTVKFILYPIENPMAVKSFQLGERFFDKVFAQAGKARFFSGVRPTLSGEAARAIATIDDAYIEMKVTQYTRRSGSQFVTQAEERFISHLRLKRGDVIGDYLEKKPKIDFIKLIDDLYPELNYGAYKKHLGPEDIFKAEIDLRNAIAKMPEGADRERLMSSFQQHLSSSSRADALAGSPTFTRPQVIANSQLEPGERISKAFEVTQVDPTILPEEAVTKLRLAILEAHESGAGSVFNYKYNDIAKKYRILTDAGFTNKQSELLIRSGLAGKPSPREAFEALAQVALPDMSLAQLDEFLEVAELAPLVKNLPDSDLVPRMQALRTMQNTGMSNADVAATFKKFKNSFDEARRLSPDGQTDGLIAEIIARQKRMNVADDLIQKKLDDAMGGCK